MTLELQRTEWKAFFELLSRDLADWETTVHILNEGACAQVWSEGLPFKGVTFEDSVESDSVTLVVGIGSINHQRHIISKPKKVTFAERGHGPAGTLDIEDAAGTSTLITFIRPGWKLGP